MDDITTLTGDRQPAAGPRSGVPAPPAARPSLLGPALVLVASLAVVALVAAALWWRSDGGRWFVVETPSMGTAMPVGTLVLTSPTDAADVAPGEVVTFRAPESGTVYTHRVVERVASQGRAVQLVTKGDVNDLPDSGSIGDADLVGRVAWSAPGLGWLVKAVPLLAVGGAATWLVSLLLARRRRRGTRMIGASLTLAVTNWLLAPWVGLEKVAQRTPDDGGPGVLVDVISLGLLPVRAEQVGGGATARLRDGEIVTMHLADRADGAYVVTAALDLAWWGWAVMGAVCLLPLVVSVLLGPDPDAVAA